MEESDVVVHSKDQDIQDWSKVALQIKEHYEKYHGFVILHGTDTMAYLASALSFMFESLGKSVIFTGSQVRKMSTVNCYNVGCILNNNSDEGDYCLTVVCSL